MRRYYLYLIKKKMMFFKLIGKVKESPSQTKELGYHKNLGHLKGYR